MRRFVILGVSVVLIAAAAIVPFALPRSGVVVYVLIGLSAMVAVGISLLMGYAGQVSIGQAAFYAIGAYTSGVVATSGLPPLLGLLLAPLVAFLLGWLIGLPLLKLRGHYLAFGTLALLLIINSVISQLDFLGGATGLQGIPPLSIGSLVIREPEHFALIVLFLLLVLMLVSRNLIRSRPGRGLRALATSEVAATSSGVKVEAYRRNIFALSAAYAGLAGGLYALFIGFISPASFTVNMSIQFVIFAVVGGLSTVFGPVIGTVLVMLLLQVLNTVGTLPGMPAELPTILNYAVYAILLLVTMLLLPEGIYPWLRKLLARVIPNARATAPAGGAVAAADVDDAASVSGSTDRSTQSSTTSQSNT